VAQRSDPFTALGLPPAPGLTDDDVRAAWRRVAAATHPDRADGGDPERFAAAAAAYTVLRTPFGRGEALADLRAAPHRAGPPRVTLPRAAVPRVTVPRVMLPRVTLPWARLPRAGLGVRRLMSRVRRGRPFRLVLRAGSAAAVGTAAALTAGSAPATPALITGALTWFALTARHDLASAAPAPPGPGPAAPAPPGPGPGAPGAPPGPGPGAPDVRAGHGPGGGSR
jgi:curved DNA-binding protein CbpA